MTCPSSPHRLSADGSRRSRAVHSRPYARAPHRRGSDRGAEGAPLGFARARGTIRSSAQSSPRWAARGPLTVGQPSSGRSADAGGGAAASREPERSEGGKGRWMASGSLWRAGWRGRSGSVVSRGKFAGGRRRR